MVFGDKLVYVRMDTYPVAKGHALVVPFRHFANYFDATEGERRSIWRLVDRTKKAWDDLHSPSGYNIGMNIGAAAGQTVPHMHVHLIPRYVGDVDDPRGGVRCVIPAKQKY